MKNPLTDMRVVLVVVLLVLGWLALNYLTVPGNKEEAPKPHSAEDTGSDEAEVSSVPSVSFDIAGSKLTLRDRARVEPDLDIQEQAFVKAYVAAVNSNSAEALLGLVHEASRTCLKNTSKDYQEPYFEEQLRYRIPERYALYFAPYVQEFEPSFQATLDYWNLDPVAHTHTFMLHYRDDRGRQETIGHKVRVDDTGVHLVLGCPTEATLVQHKQVLQQRRTQQKLLKKLWPGLSEDLKSELKALLRQGDVEGAFLAYERQATTDEQRKITGAVIEKLAAELEAEKEIDTQAGPAPDSNMSPAIESPEDLSKPSKE